MPVETSRGYKVTLSFAQRKVLWAISERSGELVLDHSTFTPDTIDGLSDLHVKGLVTRTQLVGRNAWLYKLTDLGIQVCDQIRKSS